MGLEYVPLASVAKKEERIFTRTNSDGIILDFDSDALRLIQYIRDESHRFAQKYHHKLREKRFTGSILEDAPGIGPKRRKALLVAFGSFEGVQKATVEEISKVESMSVAAAEALRKWLDTDGESSSIEEGDKKK